MAESVPIDKKVIPIDKTLYTLDTAKFAAKQMVNPNTVRREFCVSGSWKGVRPIKAAGGRLIWPDISAIDLVEARNAAA